MKNTKSISIVLITFLLTACGFAQEAKSIKLPAPQKNIGKPLMEVLANRQSARTFDAKPLDEQEVSNLLWAAFGINRPESGKRTAPSARNWQEITIYAVTTSGTYVYDAKEHSLIPIVTEDIRVLAGKQEYVKDAPLNLIYVADLDKIKDASKDDQMMYCGADAAFIAENAYLYCASQNLSVVVRAMIDREALAKKLDLKPNFKIVLAQSIGYPKK